MYTMLGIPNCDTVRKAKKFLDQGGVAYQFRDIRKQPLSEDEWRALISQDRDDKLINTRGPSFRKTGVAKGDLTPDVATALLLAQPTVMKRPVMLENEVLVSIGFSESTFQQFEVG